MRKYPEISNTIHIKSFIYEKKPKSFYTDIFYLPFIILSLSDETSGEKMAKVLSCSAKGIKPREVNKHEEDRTKKESGIYCPHCADV